MSRAAGILARALLLFAALLVLAGVLVAALGLYAGTWPIRRAARRNRALATLAALQALVLALADVLAVRRGVDG